VPCSSSTPRWRAPWSRCATSTPPSIPPQLIRNGLERRWDVEDINSIGWKDVEIKKTSEGYDIRATYKVEQPFIANVFLLAKFDKSVTIKQ